ncbi:MAG: PEGA domain-containing protein, partial [Armatimonadetes bacterium]|nr:PEGA domain-containing protein [Armatimonadota bacterium]NIO98869.1 PEGA domain-containing protein [Armatimonadota bacterium]
VLYRHGYQQVSEEIEADQDKEVKEFILTVNYALLKVESQPSRADVFVDGKKIGKTPLLDGRQVNFGFHTLKLS